MSNLAQQELINEANRLGLKPHQVHRMDRKKRSGVFWFQYFRLQVTSQPADRELFYQINKEKERLKKLVS